MLSAKMNENGELLTDFCAVNELVIGGKLFPHKECHKVTWVSPDRKTQNQIDHIAISHRWKSSLQDVRVKRGADVGSDHHLVVEKIKIRRRKSTRLNSSHANISYAVFCLKKKKIYNTPTCMTISNFLSS